MCHSQRRRRNAYAYAYAVRDTYMYARATLV
jgi:hypothetical protein